MSAPKSPPTRTQKSLRSQRPPPRQKGPPVPKEQADRLLRTRWSAPHLLRQFQQLLPVSKLASWLTGAPHQFYQRAFTPLITLWYCVFLRLSDNPHLSHAVQDARDGGADRLSPRAKRLSRQLNSDATTSFSDARQRLPLDLFYQCLRHIAERIVSCFETARWLGHPVALLDGSTVRLRPYGDIPEHFPPHRPGNCKKQPYWCVARVVGMFCLATGALLDTAVGCLKTSEQALCVRILKRTWENWVLVGDRNFGVYSVARAARAGKAHLVVRMTQARAAKLARAAGVQLVPGLDVRLSWRPSKHDQCPEGLAADPVEGRLLVVRVKRPGYRPVTLYLFTTLLDRQTYSAQALAELYGQRWNVELYLRYVKTQMDLGFLECHSAEMVRKEWVAGLIAYNLVRWALAAAAALARVPVEVLSFTRARELLLGWLQRASVRGPTLQAWKLVLTRIAQARLPKRRNPLPSEPRAIRAFQKDFAKLEGSRAKARQNLAAAHANS